jgi:PAS domain S-box-containing protein
MARFQFIRDLSIKNKIIGIIVFIAFTAISIGFIFITIRDIKRLKTEALLHLSLDAKLIGDYCIVPLTFDNRQQATEALSRLKYIESVDRGFIIDVEGNIFATYPDSLEKSSYDGIDLTSQSGYTDGVFHIIESINFEGSVIGTLYIIANSKSLAIETHKLVVVLITVFLMMLIISSLLAIRIQKLFSRPILELAEMTAKISQSQDFTIRLKPYGKDEIGFLYIQFNNFLSQISKRQGERNLAETQLKTLNEKLLTELNERSIIEASLRQSEEKYRYLFDRNPAPLAIYDPASLDVLAVNEAFLILYGYSAAEVLLMHLPDFYPNDEKGPIVDLVKGLKGHAYTGEWHHLKKDGSIFPIITTSHDIVFNSVNARIVVITDITERQKAEKEISFLAQVLRNINECVSITDVENNIIFVNQSWIRTFGYSEKEALGKSIGLVVSPSNPAGLIDEILSATLKGGWQGELINKRKDGKEFPVMVFTTIIFDKENSPIALVGISSDITEQKKIQGELLAHRDHLEDLVRERTEELRNVMEETRDLYENAPCGYHSVDANGTYVRINTTELKWLGYELDEVIGKLSIPDVLTAESLVYQEKVFSEIVKNGGIYNVELEYKRKDGTTFFGSLNSTSIFDQDGKFFMSRSTLFDITERKRIEIALSDANEAAENANKAKSEFLANMSHEIRTPMNAVLGYTELLSSLLTEQTQKNYIESIKSSGRSLLTLINDILDLSKIEAGKLDLEYDYVDSNFFFTEFERIFALKATEKGIKFIVEIQSGTPAGIYIDEPRLRQIVFNLIGNAIKFTNQGYVKLKVYTNNFQIVAYSEEKSEQFVDMIIEVEDTGIGISKEIKEEIFDPFIQARDQKNIGGTGLGLAITRRLTTLMKGTISLESTLGKGSKFTVKIPDIAFKKEFVSSKSILQINPSNIVFDESTVLVVDDVEQNRSFIKDTLRNTKITVLEAEEGFKALELAKKIVPDLIISDIRMPNMDGFELLNRLKAIKKLKDIPVLAYSASVLKDQKERIHQSKFVGLLTKPVNITDLYIELMNHLPFKEVKSAKSLQTENENSDSPVKNIKELLVSLESDLMRTWNSFEVTQPIDEVTKFGDNLVLVGTNHNSSLIVNYGKELQIAADNFDIEAILMLLKKYKSIIEKLKDLN